MTETRKCFVVFILITQQDVPYKKGLFLLHILLLSLYYKVQSSTLLTENPTIFSFVFVFVAVLQWTLFNIVYDNSIRLNVAVSRVLLNTLTEEVLDF